MKSGTMPPPDFKSVETQARRAIAVACATAFVGLVWPVTLALGDPAPRLRHPAVIDSAYFAFSLWAGAVVLMLQAARGNWAAGRPPFRAVQCAWSLAWVLFAAHVAYAFHFAHGWSHANALGHVEATAWFGPGIFVSYAFTTIWLADVLWMLAGPASYTRRPAWLGWMVHAFFVFITFNGTVVYGHGFMRWVCVAAFGVLLAIAIQSCPPPPWRERGA